MTETEWDNLRRELCRQFDEDTVQQTLLEMLEEQAKGVTILNPLHWCRMCAKRQRTNDIKHAIKGREVKQTLAALKIPYDTRSTRALAASRSRGYRKRKKEAVA